MKRGYAPGSRDIKASAARFQEVDVEEIFPRVAHAPIERDCATEAEAGVMLPEMEA